MLWVIDALSIFFVVSLGLVTSFEDIKFNKIRNKWVLSAIIFSLMMLLARFLLGYYYGLLPNPAYYAEFFSNILFAVILGYLFFELDFWSPGDAKLFIAYSALIPLSIYEWGNIKYFPSFVILINTFIPFFVYYAFYVVIKSNLKQKIKSFKEAFKPKSVAGLLLFIFGFFWIVNAFLSLINVPNHFFITLTALFLLIYLIEKLGWDKLKIGLIFSCFRLIFDHSTVFTTNFFKNFILLFLALLAISLLMGFGKSVLTKNVSVKSLKPGMVIETEEGLISLTPTKIKRLKKEKKRVIIYQTLPFSVIIFIGVLITILCKGNFLIFVRILIERFI